MTNSFIQHHTIVQFPDKRELTPSQTHRRDHRIDALRGIALLMMFIDHIPQNILNRFTMRNVGFADAAEIFVLLAGYTSWLAYGRGFKKYGVIPTLQRIGRRCVQLYIGQIIMVMGYVVMVRTWRCFVDVPPDYLEPELTHGTEWVWRVLVFNALPSNLNILPLYIVLLGIMPCVYFLMQMHYLIPLVLSGGVWALINMNPVINFPNWLDPRGWYFNPLAWQFLFVLGLILSAKREQRGADFPHAFWLSGCCWVFLIFSAFQAFPWHLWGLPDLRPIAVEIPAVKTWLSPSRVLDILIVFYLFQTSAWVRQWATQTWSGQCIACMGRHSLEIFVVSMLLDLLARLLFSTFGEEWCLQIAVNGVGILCLILLASTLDRSRKLR
ncbi:MAG: OpgC domain-containing protein [Acetobacter sp.]|nr:OpgC domain-containing protein [Acetobacter sp.]